MSPQKRKTRELRQIHTTDPVAIGQKVVPVHYTGIQCTGATFCPYRLGQLYLCICLTSLVFHFVGSYTTPFSMGTLFSLPFRLPVPGQRHRHDSLPTHELPSSPWLPPHGGAQSWLPTFGRRWLPSIRRTRLRLTPGRRIQLGGDSGGAPLLRPSAVGARRSQGTFPFPFLFLYCRNLKKICIISTLFHLSSFPSHCVSMDRTRDF